jgi:N5-(cytidine 5'-diphosphoramidyl)-L-glutamine hydrolase
MNSDRFRLGISMRQDNANGYVEPRDGLAQDWGYYFQRNFRDFAWISIPNLEEEVTSYIKYWGIQGLVLSGGHDIGVTPKRDLTERYLLAYAIDNDLPVLGICRGMQLIQNYFGGALSEVKDDAHIAKTHTVLLSKPSDTFGNFPDVLPNELIVNSFHSMCIEHNELADVLVPFALDDEGLVEAFCHQTARIIGLMWHPERYARPQSFDTSLIKQFFLNRNDI